MSGLGRRRGELLLLLLEVDRIRVEVWLLLLKMPLAVVQTLAVVESMAESLVMKGNVAVGVSRRSWWRRTWRRGDIGQGGRPPVPG